MQYDSSAKRPTFLLPKGEYPSQIVSAEEKRSKAGNPMLVVEHEVFDVATGKSRSVRDYMVIGGEHSAEWKIGHLCQSCGLSNSGDLNPADLVGRNATVKVKITPAKDGYDENNAITDYLVGEGSDMAAPGANNAPGTRAANIQKPTSSVADGEVPF